MANFCTKCAIEHKSGKPEIDVLKVFENLQPGLVQRGILCEECELSAIGKTDDGDLYVEYRSEAKRGRYFDFRKAKEKFLTEGEEDGFAQCKTCYHLFVWSVHTQEGLYLDNNNSFQLKCPKCGERNK